ncbi:MAG: hypothetical protein CL558_08785 [Alphaproteobacteria bacterium]|nr:hypothetical protein [Alphaproteobacteria bacterium]MAS46795.1 hypothetical protein [Alphaproteobacteria bacterium]MAX94890.1 hypothetical protein [Alphaproteobacteria bacterium]MBN53657.1 hypothetical protein [Alphaproteobacteria bacterium]OUT41640.1 MAG: hypothetical protein CBB62_04740 [Micavibrio sp. TMED2]|tara:strand:- start:62219 stop:62680 length:462 start_codon:yes stop_codon:yes gene_type:complete
MFMKFLRGPSPNEVVLEAAGIILGSRKMPEGHENYRLREESARQAKHIGKLLEGGNQLMDAEVRDFLTKAHRGFDRLGKIDSAIHNGTTFGTAEAIAMAYRKNPKWQREFLAFREALADQADAVIDKMTAIPTVEMPRRPILPKVSLSNWGGM